MREVRRASRDPGTHEKRHRHAQVEFMGAQRLQLGEVVPELTLKRLTGYKFMKWPVKDIPG